MKEWQACDGLRGATPEGGRGGQLKSKGAASSGGLGSVKVLPRTSALGHFEEEEAHGRICLVIPEETNPVPPK